MGDSDKGVIGLLVGGIVYGMIKLGDEFIVVLDQLFYALDSSLLVRLIITDIPRAVAEIDLTIETIVLTLFAIFLLFAIADYISTNM
jgi:hypothetical protein